MPKIDAASFWRARTRLDKTFLALVLAYAVLYFTGISAGLRMWVGTATVLVGVVVLFRLARRAMAVAIWRLRNRLIAAYLFIAVVPIVLIVSLALLAGYLLVGQMAVYLVSRELEHREASLLRPAESLARLPLADRATALNRFQMLTRNAFPTVDLLMTGDEELRYPEGTNLKQPPGAWKNVSGLVAKDGKLYCWAHVLHDGREVTAVAPVTLDLLASFVPGLGDINVKPQLGEEPLDMGKLTASHIGPPANALDVLVDFVGPLSVAVWDSPNKETHQVLRVQTRLSAVLGVIIGEKASWGEAMLTLFVFLAALFFLAEVAALVAGVRLSRTITGAVHELYQGTIRVKAGNFDYRVPVKGNDQLAELTNSFNSMTQDLSRLVLVAKEKERLESELAIAREVQAQLFPKNVPSAEGLELKGFCQPARSVSGDYYDFVKLPHTLVFAIGDVAGKGISAALLMASIQSTMRTQLTGSNGGPVKISTAHLTANLNYQLYHTTSPEKYATFFLGIYDELAHTLTYTNAGHLAPMLIRGEEVQLLEPTGTVVGAFPKVIYEEKTVEMREGDLLVAYTDGIVEPENAYGEAFGEENLQNLLIKVEDADSNEIITRTMETVTQWTAAPEQQDDMTMVVARRI